MAPHGDHLLRHALPEAHFTANPYYRKIGDFFTHLTPVGIQSSSFGNGGLRTGRLHRGRTQCFRKLAYVTGDSKYLRNLAESGRMFNLQYRRPWVEYVLPHYYKRARGDGERNDIELANQTDRLCHGQFQAPGFLRRLSGVGWNDLPMPTEGGATAIRSLTTTPSTSTPTAKSSLKVGGLPRTAIISPGTP